jgi:hypothetical protein
MHCLSDLTYGYLSLSPFEVEIPPLPLGQNLHSTVINWPGHRPGLSHSPSNIHQSSGNDSTKQLYNLLGLWDPINPEGVSTSQCLFYRVQQDAALNRPRQGLPPRSPEYLLIHPHPSHPVILHLLMVCSRQDSSWKKQNSGN